MTNPLSRSHQRIMIAFRFVCYICALYFLVMGLALMLFPAYISRIAGPQAPVIIGLLRGAGGSILPYALIYVFVAKSPTTRRWAVTVIAVANVVAIVLDLVSVYLEEYRLSYAMIDVPVEVLSLVFMLFLLLGSVGRNDMNAGDRERCSD